MTLRIIVYIQLWIPGILLEPTVFHFLPIIYHWFEGNEKNIEPGMGPSLCHFSNCHLCSPLRLKALAKANEWRVTYRQKVEKDKWNEQLGLGLEKERQNDKRALEIWLMCRCMWAGRWSNASLLMGFGYLNRWNQFLNALPGLYSKFINIYP